jgi:hypothetical protein
MGDRLVAFIWFDRRIAILFSINAAKAFADVLKDLAQAKSYFTL